MPGQTRRVPDELLQAEDGALDARLRVRVVVLDALQQLAQAPVRVRLRARHRLRRARARRRDPKTWRSAPAVCMEVRAQARALPLSTLTEVRNPSQSLGSGTCCWSCGALSQRPLLTHEVCQGYLACGGVESNCR